MSYEGGWLIPLRVVSVRVWGHITVGDLDQHTELCIRLSQEAELKAPGVKLNMIFDASEALSLPPLYLMVSRALPALRYKNRNMMFFITQNHHYKSIINLTAHVMQFKIRIVADYQEALAGVEALLVEDTLPFVR